MRQCKQDGRLADRVVRQDEKDEHMTMAVGDLWLWGLRRDWTLGHDGCRYMLLGRLGI